MSDGFLDTRSRSAQHLFLPLPENGAVMATITLSPATLTIPVVKAGQASPNNNEGAQRVALTFTGAPVVSFAITDAPAGVFVAELFKEPVIPGGVRPIPRNPPVNLPATLDPNEKYYIQMNFFAPSEPVPAYFPGTLIVSGGSAPANVALVGTTALLTATHTYGGATASPIGQGFYRAEFLVPVSIAYISSDPTTLNVQLGLLDAPPPVTIVSETAQPAAGDDSSRKPKMASPRGSPKSQPRRDN
jgi:hypothetical protein